MWWTVLVITVATYFASVGMIDYQCLAGSFDYIESKQALVHQVYDGTIIDLYRQLRETQSCRVSAKDFTVEYDHGCLYRCPEFDSLIDLPRIKLTKTISHCGPRQVALAGANFLPKENGLGGHIFTHGDSNVLRHHAICACQ